MSKRNIERAFTLIAVGCLYSITGGTFWWMARSVDGAPKIDPSRILTSTPTVLTPTHTKIPEGTPSISVPGEPTLLLRPTRTPTATLSIQSSGNSSQLIRERLINP